MRRFVMLPFFMSLILSANAQLPGWLTAKVDSVNVAVARFGEPLEGNDADSILAWNDHAVKSLMAFLNTPGIALYPFEEHLLFDHHSSPDGRLTLVSLRDNWNPYSVVKFHTNILFFRQQEGGVHTALLSTEGPSLSDIDTVQMGDSIHYVWTEYQKECHPGCYSWALKCFPDGGSGTPGVSQLLHLSGTTGDDFQYYDPVTKMARYRYTLGDISGSFSEEELSSLWTDPERMEQVETEQGTAYVIQGIFSVRRALMKVPDFKGQ